MLLLELRDDAAARRRYVKLAGPFALANMIGGIARAKGGDAQAEHAVIPMNEEEFQLLLSCLQTVSDGVLRLRDWEQLMGAADLLIPREACDGDLGAVDLSELGLGMIATQDKLSPSEMDLAAFRCTWSGRIVLAICEGFARQRTFENSHRFTASEWARLLSRFYDLASYLARPQYPSFTSDLCHRIEAASLELIRLINVIQQSEPMVVRQYVAPSIVNGWKSLLESKAEELISSGEDFKFGGDPQDFDEWAADVKSYLQTVEDLISWSSVEQIEHVSDLAELQDVLVRPEEVDEDREEDDHDRYSGPYWSIDRIFEDL